MDKTSVNHQLPQAYLELVSVSFKTPKPTTTTTKSPTSPLGSFLLTYGDSWTYTPPPKFPISSISPTPATHPFLPKMQTRTMCPFVRFL